MVTLKYLENKDVSAPWLLFIHGIGGTWEMWKKQVDFLKEKFNICLVNLPGHGDAELSENERNSPNIFKTVAKEIIEELKKKNIKKITTISCSLGTIVNYFLCKEDKDLVDKAVLTGAVCGCSKPYACLMNVSKTIRNFLPHKVLISVLGNILMPKANHKISRKYLLSECKKMKSKDFKFWMKNAFERKNEIKNSDWQGDNIYMVAGDEDHVFVKNIKKFAKEHSFHMFVMKHCGHVCSLHKWREFNQYLMEILIPNPQTI